MQYQALITDRSHICCNTHSVGISRPKTTQGPILDHSLTWLYTRWCSFLVHNSLDPYHRRHWCHSSLVHMVFLVHCTFVSASYGPFGCVTELFANKRGLTNYSPAPGPVN